MATAQTHLARLRTALGGFEEGATRVGRWGHEAAERLLDGHRLLAAGNGGSAAEAQHLTAELVGRYQDERRPLSAIALHAETSTMTAVLNDYGEQEVFARQVRAHGRQGDLLVLLSTSGRSPNVLAAAEAGKASGLTVWGLTGRSPGPLAQRCHDVVAVPASDTATIQELHLVAVHLLAGAVDERVTALTTGNGAMARVGIRA